MLEKSYVPDIQGRKRNSMKAEASQSKWPTEERIKKQCKTRNTPDVTRFLNSVIYSVLIL